MYDEPQMGTLLFQLKAIRISHFFSQTAVYRLTYDYHQMRFSVPLYAGLDCIDGVYFIGQIAAISSYLGGSTP